MSGRSAVTETTAAGSTQIPSSRANLRCIAKAVELGGANREGTCKALTGIGTASPAVMGALGENKFDANGDMVRDMFMYIVKGGKAVSYK